MSSSSSTPTRSVTHVRGRTGVLIRLSGPIDEHFDAARLVTGVRGTVVIDLDAVHRITSFGVRAWLDALARLDRDYLGFVNCRPAIVSQFNMVARFGGGGQLISFYAPYICPKCSADIEVLVDLRTAYTSIRNFALPTVACTSCGQQAEFDDLPEVFLSHVSGAPQPAPPPAAEALMKGASAALPLKVSKEVKHDVTALWLSGDLSEDARVKRLADGLDGTVVVLCEGLQDISARGLCRLTETIVGSAAETFLARIPPPMAELIVGDPSRLGAARVVSARVPYACGTCKWHGEIDIDATFLETLPSGGAGTMTCPTCSGRTLPQVPTTFKTACQLSLTKPPPSVLTYLSNNSQLSTTVDGEEAQTSAKTFGRYRLLRLLGVGGMAEVFLAEQTGLGGFQKNVVIKRILPNLAQNSSFVAMFLQEARLAARITSPNVVEIYDVGQIANNYFIAMEYVRGLDLNSLLKLAARSKVKASVGVACRITASICAGLNAAHSNRDELNQIQPIIHRDVSPHNVLVSETGYVKLADFGIAKAAGNPSDTPTKTLKGKLAYMAPEQLATGESIDPRVDIFPTGLILFQCLTFEHVFRRPTEMGTFQALLNDPVPSVRSVRSDAPPELDNILGRALQRDRSARYPTAAAFQDDLERLMANNNLHAGLQDVAAWVEQVLLSSGYVSAEEHTPSGVSLGEGEDPSAPDAATTAFAARKPGSSS